MRTKNAKRLWLVPATLTVVALAALLALGLMATTGAQPAAAQSDDPCVTVMAASGAVNNQTPTTLTTALNAEDEPGCNSAVTPAVIELTGQITQGADDVSNFVIYGSGIGGSGTQVYPPNTKYGNHDSLDTTDDIFFTGDAPDGVKAEPLPAIAIQVGPGTVDISGTSVGSTKTFTVAGTPPKTVTVYVAQGTEFTDPVAGNGTEVPQTGGKASVTLDVARVKQLDIIFLGAPAVGKDLADDNKKIDDVVMQQCRLATDTTRMRLVGEAVNCAVADPPGALDVGAWAQIEPNPDKMESRSKLVVRTGLPDATSQLGMATPLIDGKMVTHTLEGDDDTVTIYALVEDGAGKALLDTEVSFRSTTVPSDIVAQRDLSDDVETKAVIVEGTATRDQILVDGLETADGSPVGTDIEIDDAVASYTLDALPSDDDDAYRITVEVMAGNVKLGTVMIERTGDPVVLKAGVFNLECLVDDSKTADYYSDDKVDLEAKGCDASGMLRRFGADDVIVVKAHLEDSLGSVVGSSSSLDSELADDFDDPLDPMDRTRS